MLAASQSSNPTESTRQTEEPDVELVEAMPRLAPTPKSPSAERRAGATLTLSRF